MPERTHKDHQGSSDTALPSAEMDLSKASVTSGSADLRQAVRPDQARDVFVSGVWIPLPVDFQNAIDKAVSDSFVAKNMITITSGQMVLRQDVELACRKAEGPLASTFQKLESVGRGDIVKLIQDIYPQLMPYFIEWGPNNPVTHTAYVLEFMTTIMIGEGKAQGEPDQLKIGVLAALFHDAAQGLSKLPKITEDHLRDMVRSVVSGEKTLSDLRKYRDDCIAARKEHMEKGALIAGRMLQAYPEGVSKTEREGIQEIIEHHDDAKIPVAYDVIRAMFETDQDCIGWGASIQGDDDKREQLNSLLSEDGSVYLIKPDQWLLQYHHEADALWMLTQDGIEADLARFPPTKGKTAHGMIENNISLHQSEVNLYKDRESFTEYGFLGEDMPTLYRTETGYLLFEHLTTILHARFPNPGTSTS